MGGTYQVVAHVAQEVLLALEALVDLEEELLCLLLSLVGALIHEWIG